jgi:guanylate kinase
MNISSKVIKSMKGKLIIFAAPSGAGKTTIVKHLLSILSNEISFSISATSRPIRRGEIDGKDYHFLSIDEFKNKIEKEEFVEWEEVYTNNFYGTLKSEVNRIWENGKDVIFDMDVIGALNLKKQFGDKAISIIVLPPSIKDLEERLKLRRTETPESIERRLDKAETELKTADKFDYQILNRDLDIALLEAEKIVRDFINE